MICLVALLYGKKGGSEMRKRLKINVRRLIASVLVLMELSFVFLPTSVQASTDSGKTTNANVVLQTYLDIMGGTKLDSLSDVSSMTHADLRVIALFLSNFYQPFGTSFDGESLVATKTKMESSLVSIGLDKDMASQLIDTTYNYSLDTANKIYIKIPDDFEVPTFSTDSSGTLGKIQEWSTKLGEKKLKEIFDKLGLSTSHEVRFTNSVLTFTTATAENAEYQSLVGEIVTDADGNKYTPLTLWLFNNIVSAISASQNYKKNYYDKDSPEDPVVFYFAYVLATSLDQVYSRVKDGEFAIDSTQSILNMDKHLYRMAKNESGEVSPVAVGCMDLAFCETYSAMIKDTDASTGLVGNHISCTDIRGKGNDYLMRSDSDKAKLITFCQNMYVDWVGNIMCDYGDKRVCVIPACTNTMALTKITDANPGQNGDNGTSIPSSPVYQSTWGIHRMNTCFDKNGTTFTQKSGRNKSLNYVWKYGGTEIVDGVKGSTGTAFGDEVLWDDLVKNKGFKTENAMFLNTNSGWSPKLTPCKQVWLSRGSVSPMMLHFDATKSGYSTYDTETLLSLKEHIQTSGIYSGNFTEVSKFSSSDDSGEFKGMMQATSADTGALCDILFTYLYAWHNRTATSYNEEENIIDLKFNSALFGEDSEYSEPVQWSYTSGSAEEVLSFIYFLLHPTEGFAYVTTLLKNKISAFIVSWHEDIVGGTQSNTSTGTTKYLGFSGYISTPTLSDLSWMAWLLENYNIIVIYLIIIMTIIVFCFVVTGALTVSKGLIGVTLFAVLAFLPPFAINSTVNIVNTTCDAIFSSKFDYWALVNHQSYLPVLTQVNANNYKGTSYATKMMETNSVSSSPYSAGGESSTMVTGVRVKWQMAKKWSSLYGLSSILDKNLNGDGTNFVQKLLMSGYTSINTDQSFLDSENATYLYREYLDIYKCSSATYSVYDTAGYCFRGEVQASNYALSSSNTGQNGVGLTWSGQGIKGITYDSGQAVLDYVFANLQDSSTYSGLPSAVKETSSTSYIDKGFLFALNTGKNYYTTRTRAVSLFLRYIQPVFDSHSSYAKFSNAISNNTLDLSRSNLLSNMSSVTFGIPKDKFKMTLTDITEGGKRVTDKPVTFKPSEFSYWVYGLYCESPYYYFDFYTRDSLSYLSGYGFDYSNLDSESKTQHLKDLFLREDQSYFFNMQGKAGEGYGELRDFTNMHDYFYYIIPCLREGNRFANAWNETYGLYLYDSTGLVSNDDGTYSLGASGSHLSVSELVKLQEVKDMSDEQLYQLWHDINVYQIFNSYTSWLDLMYNCDYAKAETINVAGTSFVVQDPLDPTSYYSLDATTGEMLSGRYMVFSKSEMAYYGLKDTDLTEVERKIIKFQDNVYANSIDLMNYYTLSDEVMSTAYAMMQTFEFNKLFSQSGLFSQDYVLYPQGYELKTFTYDAYMRLILAGSSNESLMSNDSTTGENKSIYMRILENTSLFFGIALLMNDFIAVYLIPSLKLVFLIVIFLMSVAMIVVATLRLNEDTSIPLISTVWKSLISPLIAFAITTIVAAFIVSLFMTNGADAVVDSTLVISLGDPTMVTIFMLFLNGVLLVLYFLICKKCVKDLITFIKAIATAIQGAVSGTLKKALSALTAGGKQYKYNKLLNTIEGVGAGKGVASTPSQRGADNTPSGRGSGLGLGGVALGGAAGVVAATAGSVDARSDIAKTGANAYNEGVKAVANKYNTSKYEDMEMPNKTELDKKHAESATGKFGKAKDDLTKNTADFKANKAKFMDKDAGAVGKAEAIRGMASSGLASVRNAKDAGINGVKSAPARALNKFGNSMDKKTNGSLTKARDFGDALFNTKRYKAKNEVKENNRRKAQFETNKSTANKLRKKSLEREKAVNSVGYDEKATQKAIERQNRKREARAGKKQSSYNADNVVNFASYKNSNKSSGRNSTQR